MIYISAEVIAAKTAIAVASDKRGRIAIATILYAIIMLFFLPLIVYMGVTSSMNEIKIDADQAQYSIVHNMSAEEKEKLKYLESVMLGISNEFHKRELNNYTIKKAQALYACALYNAEKSDYDFISKYADCFEQSKTDDDLRNAILSAFGVVIKQDDFNHLDEHIQIILTEQAINTQYQKCYDANSSTELEIICAKHALWIYGEPGGERADFSNCLLENVDLSNCNLCGADFSGAALIHCKLDDASMCDADFKETEFKQCSLRHFTAEEADFKNSDFYNCDLRGAYFTHSNFTNAKIADCNFHETSFMNCCLESWICTDCNLNIANMTNVNYLESDWLSEANGEISMGGM